MTDPGSTSPAEMPKGRRHHHKTRHRSEKPTLKADRDRQSGEHCNCNGGKESNVLDPSLKPLATILRDRVADDQDESVDKTPDPLDAVERCIAAAVKGFFIGSGLKGGLALFSLLGRLRGRASKRSTTVGGLSMRDASWQALRETRRYGMFLGTFAGGYCAVDEIIASIWGARRTAKWRNLVAGAAAGPALLLTGRKEKHNSLAIYIFLRALVLGARCGMKSPRLGWLFHPLSWEHGDAFLMCLSVSQILYAWILEPQSLPSSYIAFLNKHGGKDPLVVGAIKDVATSQRPLNLEAVQRAFAQRGGVDIQLDPNMALPCGMLHPNQGCAGHFVSFLWRAYLRAVPVYLPVYIIPALLVHRRALLDRPLPILSKTIKGVARSSLFLASFCSCAWLSTCCLHQLTGTCSGATVAIGTFPSGLAVLFEKKSRRMELALYCLSRAVESFAICASRWRFISAWTAKAYPIRLRADVLLFCAATAGIMHCYANERDVFRSKYLNVLDWVFECPLPTPERKSVSTIHSATESTLPLWKEACRNERGV